jgi:hypothetical protein
MPEDPPVEMKPCPYCGRMTSAKANFCWYCARELSARPERPMDSPKPARINWVLVGVIVAAVLILAAFLLLR